MWGWPPSGSESGSIGVARYHPRDGQPPKEKIKVGLGVVTQLAHDYLDYCGASYSSESLQGSQNYAQAAITIARTSKVRRLRDPPTTPGRWYRPLHVIGETNKFLSVTFEFWSQLTMWRTTALTMARRWSWRMTIYSLREAHVSNGVNDLQPHENPEHDLMGLAEHVSVGSFFRGALAHKDFSWNTLSRLLCQLQEGMKQQQGPPRLDLRISVHWYLAVLLMAASLVSRRTPTSTRRSPSTSMHT